MHSFLLLRGNHSQGNYSNNTNMVSTWKSKRADIYPELTLVKVCPKHMLTLYILQFQHNFSNDNPPWIIFPTRYSFLIYHDLVTRSCSQTFGADLTIDLKKYPPFGTRGDRCSIPGVSVKFIHVWDWGFEVCNGPAAFTAIKIPCSASVHLYRWLKVYNKLGIRRLEVGGRWAPQINPLLFPHVVVICL